MDIPENRDWVTERSKCSLEGAFHCLAEVIDGDVRTVNALNRPGVSFVCHRPLPGKIVVARTRDFVAIKEVDTVVFELTKNAIVATSKDAAGNGPELFKATPSFQKTGICWLNVNGEDVRAWQVSCKALEDLFFNF